MKPTLIASPTIKYSAPENWDEKANGPCGDLYVRVEQVGPNKLIEQCSCWKPSPEELDHLCAGGVVEVRLCIANQPAMRMGVVDAVPDALAEYSGGASA